MTSEQKIKMYYYKTITKYGERLNGYVLNLSYKDVFTFLNQQNLTILSIHRRALWIERIRFNQEILIHFLKGLEWSLRAEQSIALGLKTLETKGFFGILVQDLLRQVSKGQLLSQACQGYGVFIPPVVIAFIRQGEISGNLRHGIQYAHAYLEKRRLFKKQCSQVLKLPMLSLGACMLTGYVLYHEIGQLLLPILIEKHMSLSLWTKVLLYLTKVSWNLWCICGSIALTVLILGYLVFLPRSKECLHTLLFRWSAVYANIYYAHSFEMLSGLLNAQVPLLQALYVTEETVQCLYVKHALKMLISVIKEGGNLSLVCGTWVRFPKQCLQLLRYGQENAYLQNAITQVSELFSINLDQKMQAWIRKLPLLCIGMVGFLLLFFVQSIVVPLYDSVELLSHG